MNKGLIAVAISGGVDSAVAALLLKKQGFEVFGLHMSLMPGSGIDGFAAGKGSKKEYLKDKAGAVCRSLEIPLHTVDVQDEFKKSVIDYFCQGYISGKTPNPCVMCNRYIKFGLLLEKALSLKADCLATGHYARIKSAVGGYRLLKGIDRNKDQSYVLYRLNQEMLKHIVFPLGEYRKPEVRKIAREAGLPVSEEPGSQDICFIDGKYGDFLGGYTDSRPGDIVTTEGKVVGTHRGIVHYTVGQRQGLGISADSRRFVVALDPEKNRIVVGTEQDLYSGELIAKDVNWLHGQPDLPSMDLAVKIRYRSPEVPAKIYPGRNETKVEFVQPQRAIAPGQSVVFYDGDEVIGGGIIGNRQ